METHFNCLVETFLMYFMVVPSCFSVTKLLGKIETCITDFVGFLIIMKQNSNSLRIKTAISLKDCKNSILLNFTKLM